jgi:hypothetical protein
LGFKLLETGSPSQKEDEETTGEQEGVEPKVSFGRRDLRFEVEMRVF